MFDPSRAVKEPLKNWADIATIYPKDVQPIGLLCLVLRIGGGQILKP